MKQGRTLVELAQEIERQNNAKADYVADSRALSVTTLDKGGTALVVAGQSDPFPINDHARRQLADKLKIPFAYFQRLETDHPDLLRDQVNALMQREPQRNMIRTLDGKVRGIMSDAFRPLDNYDLADVVLPMAQEAGVQVASCDVTETKLFIKLLIPGLERELPIPAGLEMGKGHNFFPRKITGAVTIGNSEVGAGSLFVDPGTFEFQCTNYATYKREGFRKLHLGRKHEGSEDVTRYLTDQTKRLRDAAVWAEFRDTIRATMDGRVMDAIVAQLVEARGDVIEGNPAKLVEVFARKNALSETETGGLLRHLTNAGESTRYGLQWAVTRLAQDSETYDRASELERLGGQVIELPRSEWRELAKAA